MYLYGARPGSRCLAYWCQAGNSALAEDACVMTLERIVYAEVIKCHLKRLLTSVSVSGAIVMRAHHFSNFALKNAPGSSSRVVGFVFCSGI